MFLKIKEYMFYNKGIYLKKNEYIFISKGIY